MPKSPKLSKASLRKLIETRKDDSDSVLIKDGDREIGTIELVSPPVAAVMELQPLIRSAGDPNGSAFMEVALGAVRACVPDLEGATDDEVWKVIRWTGGASGELVTKSLGLLFGGKADAPDPT